MSTEPTKHLETETYTHKGVGVTVEINYDEGTISLVDGKQPQSPGRFASKKWLFAGRTLEYIQGWQNIFDAMKHAVEEAHKKLQRHQDAQEKARAKLEERVIKAIAKERA